MYLEGSGADLLAGYATVVASPEEADVAIVRIGAPYEQRGTMFENFFHAGSLEMAAEQVEHLLDVAAKVPTVLDVYLDRPAILTPVVDAMAAVVVNFGASPAAVFDVLFGAAEPRGRLPIEIRCGGVIVYRDLRRI